MKTVRFSEELILRPTGLTPGWGQSWGALRLVPLLRAEPILDLRLATYRAETYSVQIEGRDPCRGVHYTGYLPYGLVVDWTADARPVVTTQTALGARNLAKVARPLDRRLVREVDKNRLRMFPLHLAIEGFLGLAFGGPDILEEAWSRTLVYNGLSPRSEAALSGEAMPDLAEALRVFEVVPGQCGALIYLGGVLAQVLVVPHPGDYLALHRALLEDVWGPELRYFSEIVAPEPEFRLDPVDTLQGLRAAFEATYALWTQAEAEPSQVFWDQPLASQKVKTAGPYTLHRFFTPLGEATAHLGEVMVGRQGQVAYLKSYRLDQTQRRRGHILATLDRAGWDKKKAADILMMPEATLDAELVHLGLGWMLRKT